MSYVQAAVLGVLQGISELFPISSLGHSVILPGLLGWRVNEQDNFFLIFLVATHLATALVLFVMYRRDWWRILKGLARSLRQREVRSDDAYAKLGWLLVVATVPAGLLGLLFEDQIRAYFISARSAALFLALNGLLLFLAEALRRRSLRRQAVGETADPDKRIARLSWGQALKVGVLQSIALIPGFSRTGSTIAGGLLEGLSHEDALRFSFLLATPIIGAAAALKIPELLTAGSSQAITAAFIGAVCAGAAAYAAVRFLVKYFKTNTLVPFAVYCALLGIVALFLLKG